MLDCDFLYDSNIYNRHNLEYFMKHLVILRHGNYLNANPQNQDRGLSSVGISQYEKLAGDIKKITYNGSVYIITSPAPRAFWGAEILAARLKVVAPPEKILFLWDAPDIPKEYDGVRVDDMDNFSLALRIDRNEARTKLEGIVEERSGKADTLVIISHRDLITDLYFHFTMKNFRSFEKVPFEYGQGVHLDLGAKSRTNLPLQ